MGMETFMNTLLAAVLCLVGTCYAGWQYWKKRKTAKRNAESRKTLLSNLYFGR